jgi:hypothetical protein
MYKTFVLHMYVTYVVANNLGIAKRLRYMGSANKKKIKKPIFIMMYFGVERRVGEIA